MEGITIEFKDIEFTIPGTDNKIYDKLNLKIPADQSLNYWEALEAENRHLQNS